MILAAAGDIAGNLEALRTVLDDAEDRGIHLVLQTGNLFHGGANANGVAELLRASGARCVQGGNDRLLVPRRRARLADTDPDAARLLDEAHTTLRPAHIEWVCGLPWKQMVEMDGLRVMLCHGSPAGRNDIITAETPTLKLRRLREMDPVDIVVCGGAPEPFARFVDGTLFVCPGPVAGDGAAGAAYALVSTEGGQPRAEWVGL